MKLSLFALALAGAAYAAETADYDLVFADDGADVDTADDFTAADTTDIFTASFELPAGLELAKSPKKWPKNPGPPAGHKPLWHPGHGKEIIDDCDSDDHDWHWVHPVKPGPVAPPPKKWTTSSVTVTKTKTVIGCGPKVHDCPAKTPVTTVTVIATTTICPVPATTPPPPPKTTVCPPPPPPSPPKPTPAPPPKPTPAPPSPPKDTPAPPPAVTSKPTSVGTVTKPAPSSTTSRAVVVANVAQNVQAAGGALAAVALAAAALI